MTARIIRYSLLLILLILFPTLSHAQEMSVRSFTLAETDLTANTPGTSMLDQNGEPCALIKVETTQTGFSFDVGTLGVVETLNKTAEIWVYVPHGVRKITIAHPQLGIIRDFQFPIPIDAARTYILQMTTAKVTTVVEEVPTKQFVLIEYTPADAILSIDGKVKASSNGVYQELLSFGKHSYDLQAQDYYSTSGDFFVNDPTNTHRLSLSLKPAFGWISISTGGNEDYNGAHAYVNDKYIGDLPIKTGPLASGTYRVRVIKEMYDCFETIVAVEDEKTSSINVELKSDYAQVELISEIGAEIYVNGERKAIGKWQGRLSTGSYVFETQKTGHRASITSRDIMASDSPVTIQLNDPIPVYGSLVVSTVPANAELKIDGVGLGETPKFIPQLLIGEHNLSISLDGYKTITQTVSIKEGEELKLEKELSKGVASANNATSHSGNGQTITALLRDGISLFVGESFQIQAEPSNECITRCESSDPDIVSVSNTGELRALKEGTSMVWVYSDGYGAKYCRVKVLKTPYPVDTDINSQQSQSRKNGRITGVKEDKIKMRVGETHELIAWPQNVIVKSYEVTGDAVRVSSTGTLLAIKKGLSLVWIYGESGLGALIRITVK